MLTHRQAFPHPTLHFNSLNPAASRFSAVHVLLAPANTYWLAPLGYKSLVSLAGSSPSLLWLDCVIGFMDNKRKRAQRRFKTISTPVSRKGDTSLQQRGMAI